MRRFISPKEGILAAWAVCRDGEKVPEKAKEEAASWMIITAHDLKGMDFLAHALLSPGRMIEPHVDPYEEIYFVLEGNGLIRVGDEEKEVKPMEATYLPAGIPHALTNTKETDLKILVVAAPLVRDFTK